MEEAYLIGLVIVLWVVLEDLLLLGVVPCRKDLIELGVFPPLLALDEPAMPSVNMPLRQGHASWMCLHLLGELNIELASAQEPQLFRMLRVSQYSAEPASLRLRKTLCRETRAYQCEGVETLGEALSLEVHAQLGHLGLLYGRQIARVSVRRNRSSGRVVVVIVLGVELQRRGRGFGGGHCDLS